MHIRDNGASHNGRGGEEGRAIVGEKDEGAVFAVFPFSAAIRDFHNAMTEDGRGPRVAEWMERRIDR